MNRVGKQGIEIQALIRALDHFSKDSFPVKKVSDFLRATPLVSGELERYLFFDECQYTRNLIYKSASVELMAICWEPSQGAPPHGHEGEKCWARVEMGELVFTNYREVPDPPGVRLQVVAELVGGPGYLDGPADIHQVENRSSERAVSLHVYSFPYQECDIYNPEGTSKARKSLDYHSEFGIKRGSKS